jgi:hypothetical protein
MNEALRARDFIVDFLRREIVGPSPGYPAVQLNGEEILRAQDPPRQRYGAGILFPQRTQLGEQEETGEEEKEPGDAASPEPDGIVASANDDPGDAESERVDLPPETEQEVNLANQFLPSAMGLTALVDVPETLAVKISAARYDHEVLEWEKRKDKDGLVYFPRAWWRRSIDSTVTISYLDLIGREIKYGVKTVVEEHGEPALILHIVSRPYHETGRSDRLRLVTFTLLNCRRTAGSRPANEECFFQSGFSVTDQDGTRCFLSYPERRLNEADPEELSLQLLYRHRRTFAVGHGCAPEWDDPIDESTTSISTTAVPTFEIKPILPAQVKDLDLRMMEFAQGDMARSSELCRALVREYGDWIATREAEVISDNSLSAKLKETARRHLANCRKCLGRMEAGVQLLEEDANVSRAFQLMNEAMLKQQIHYEIASRSVRSWKSGPDGLQLERPFSEPTYDDPNRKWYPFQLAFILMNLVSMNDPQAPDREIVDLIWFPTGGGKTEAYLGLSAFTMFLRRLRDPSDGGTCTVMRYTLRLLTTQQFQRASSLICACEIIRRGNIAELGPESFSIGLWVGREVTPNTEEAAVTALRMLQSGRGANKFIMLSCPWCGAAMGPQAHGKAVQCKGYRKLAHPNRVRFLCDDPACRFNSGEGLPMKVIDEQIYASPPTLLVGTVDKFAMLAFQPEARHIFGIDTTYSPPELVIQDELHLISGPLGSMVGHYETVVDALCTTIRDGAQVLPKIIASTATISRAEDQVRMLYGRQAFLFPPQALRAGNSFFAQEREDQVGRLYVGILGTALPSHVTAQVRVMSALLQAPKLFETTSIDAIDPYWTMLGYFNSLRELGHAATLIRADIREYLNAVWDRLGLRLDHVQALKRDPRRFINRDVELTSRVQSSEIPAILQQLFTKYDGGTSYDAIDVCFATNMIQVGLDIPRLSLMTVVGQPKTTSEYIQASSRVGRNVQLPGLVVTNFNPFKPRDRSHYEHFKSYHQSIYRNVEPTSVTPFSAPVRDRALHALVIILCRFWGSDELRARPEHPPPPALVERIRAAVRDRVMAVEPDEWPATEALFDEIIAKWSVAPPPRYGNFGPPSEQMPLMYPAGTQQHPLWGQWPFATPSSMRNVDSDCGAKPLVGGYGATAFL